MSTANDDWADFGAHDGSTSVDASWADFDSFGSGPATALGADEASKPSNWSSDTNGAQTSINNSEPVPDHSVGSPDVRMPLLYNYSILIDGSDSYC